MGRVDDKTNQGPASPLPIKHLSHPHELEQILADPQNPSLCSCCKMQSSGIMYTCRPCNFSLHVSCTKFPGLITHPSHPGCSLSLLVVPSYPGGHFNCDACARRGDGFSYHCTKCDYDLHVICAKMPLKITHQAHSCPLELAFTSPYGAKGFSCDVCGRLGSNQWLYRCKTCEFDVHLYCTRTMPKPASQNLQFALQHQHSFPAVGGQPSHLVHSASTSAVMHNQYQVPVGQAHGPLMHSASTGGIGNHQMAPVNPGQFNQYAPANQPARTNANGIGNQLLMAAAQGFVEGAFQEVGQNVMQGFIGGGDGGSGGGESGGDLYPAE